MLTRSVQNQIEDIAAESAGVVDIPARWRGAVCTVVGTDLMETAMELVETGVPFQAVQPLIDAAMGLSEEGSDALLASVGAPPVRVH